MQQKIVMESWTSVQNVKNILHQNFRIPLPQQQHTNDTKNNTQRQCNNSTNILLLTHKCH